MNMIPGMYPSGVGLGQRWPSLPYDFSPSPASHPQVTPVQPYAPTPTPVTPVTTSHLDFVTPIHSSNPSQYNPPNHHNIHLDQPPVTLPIHPPPPPVSIERAAPMGIERAVSFDLQCTSWNRATAPHCKCSRSRRPSSASRYRPDNMFDVH